MSELHESRQPRPRLRSGIVLSEMAIKDLVHSAFGHAGQKCSTCSLAILEVEVYDDPHFRQQLRDTAASWSVGSPWEARTHISPLIRPPGAALLRGLTELLKK
ncbi:MAG: aldehyde dehydrogenase family protein [Chlamydiales bacterium]